jgi:ribulose-bisphosphate carboxylase large chain
VEPAEITDVQLLPGAARLENSILSSGNVTIEFPIENFGGSLAALIIGTMGNLYEMRQLAAVRLVSLQLPLEFAGGFLPPQFGIEGTRSLIGEPNAPLIGAVIKPAVGLDPRQTAEIVSVLVEAGVDFIKDDELMSNPTYSTVGERAKRVMGVINAHSAKTGRKVMYAFNITDEPGRMLAHHDLLVELGATCVMVCVNAAGFPALAELRRAARVPIHVHRTGIGALIRPPSSGMSYRVFQTLARLAGADQIHTIGFSNVFFETDDEIEDNVRAVQTPLFTGWTSTLPVLSSGQWAGTVPLTYRRLKSADFLMLAGPGIFSHPRGAAAGVLSIKQAWEATVRGFDLHDYARTHLELAEALDKFGEPVG